MRKLDTEEIELTFAEYALEKFEVVEKETSYDIKLSDEYLMTLQKSTVETNLLVYNNSLETAFKSAMLERFLHDAEYKTGKKNNLL